MDRTERFYKIDQLIHEQTVVPFAALKESLGISRATVKRDLEYLRNRLNAPIVWDRDAGGYRYAAPERHGGQFELPGLWFNAEEIHALLTMQHLLANLDTGGLLGPHIQPLMARLTSLLGTGKNPAQEVKKRVKIISIAARSLPLEHFAALGSALLRRKRLHITYYAKGKDEVTEREISPQRLVHYRENWYLDAWCHMRRGLRSFAVDAIRRAETLEKAARNVPDGTLDAVLGSGYGIFSGRRVTWAKLRFTPERSRWVSSEQWHPRQRSRREADGSYVLQVPYSDDRELLMDILKYGADVQVLAPESLKVRVLAEVGAVIARYAGR